MNVSNASANHASISLYVVGLVNYAGPLKVQYAFVSMSADANKLNYQRYLKKESANSMDKCCGTCKWHKFENISDGFVCVNSDSDYCADWTEYGDSCEEWEKRNE